MHKTDNLLEVGNQRAITFSLSFLKYSEFGTQQNHVNIFAIPGFIQTF